MLGYLVNPTTQFISKSGLPLTDGCLTVYIASSTTTAVTYSDFEGTLNQTSIELDSLGQAVVIADDSYAYDLYVYDSAGVLQYSRMNVTVNNASSSSVSEVNESLIEVSSSLMEDIETKQDSFNLSGNLEWLNDSATLHSPYYSGSDYISIEDNVVSLNDPKTLVIDSPLSSYETTSKIHIGLDEDYVKEEELTGYVTLSDFKTYTGSHYGEWYSISQSNSNLSKRMTSAETNTASLASDTASLDEAINTLEGYSYSYTPEVTEGTLLGTLTLKDTEYEVYAPETSDADLSTLSLRYGAGYPYASSYAYSLGTAALMNSSETLSTANCYVHYSAIDSYSGMRQPDGAWDSDTIQLGTYKYKGQNITHDLPRKWFDPVHQVMAGSTIVYDYVGHVHFSGSDDLTATMLTASEYPYTITWDRTFFSGDSVTIDNANVTAYIDSAGTYTDPYELKQSLTSFVSDDTMYFYGG